MACRQVRGFSSPAASGWLTVCTNRAVRMRRANCLNGFLPYATTLDCCRRNMIRAAKRLVGNFPQAFSHIGLISTAMNLFRGERRSGPAAQGGWGQLSPARGRGDALGSPRDGFVRGDDETVATNT